MRRSFNPDQALTASTRVTYEVFVTETADGSTRSVSTGRAFTSLVVAERYARSVGGEVRTRS